MKITITFVTLLLSLSVSAESCLYGISVCGVNEACIKTDKKIAQCISQPDIIPTVNFPLKAEAGIYCDQGNLSLEGNSHTFTNTAYALDLASNRSASAGTAVAAADGLIISYSKCTTINDQCGNGFGNYIQILRDDGFLIFYAHLEKVFVRTGERVSIGQKIGFEGNSGWTGENNRHLHFSVHYNWKNISFETLKKNVGWLPNSGPFKMNNLDSRDIKCSRVTGHLEWLSLP